MPVCRSCGERNPDRARFCMMCAEPLGVLPGREETRRLVTILFADMKGSTEIGERLDAEAVRRVLSEFYGAAREILERNGGRVEKFIGDAVMAVFGVPRVREDDAARAVRAAWELQRAMTEMRDRLVERYGAAPQLRIGVNSGEVVAGDPATGSSFVAGDAVNVAARLEQSAAPGEVLVGELTRQLARSMRVEAVDPLALKGKSEPVSAFLLLGLQEADRGATHRFVGRENELAAIASELDDVVETGRARVLALRGAVGIGKTRLLEEAAIALGGRALVVRTRCLAEGEGDDLEPMRSLATQLTSAGDPTPSVIAEGARSAAAHEPVVVMVDDAHAAGDVVRRNLDEVARRITGLQVLWVEALRTDREVPASERDLPLGPLARVEAVELIDAIAGPVSGHVAERVLELAEGNPLFLVESARLLAERGEGSELPGTVRAVLQARLDALPEDERAVTQTASVLGRTFASDVLSKLVPETLGPAVPDLVLELEGRGVLSPAGDGRTAFGHGTMREVAYQTITKSRRADLHEAAATLLEAAGSPGLVVGHHLERAIATRTELGALDARDREVADRASLTLASAGTDRLSRADRAGAAKLLGRAWAMAGLAGDRTKSGRGAAGDLAFELGHWDETVTAFGAEDAGLSPARMRALGVALCKRSRDDPESDEMVRGRRLLEQVAEETHDPDAWASLAGTWKGIDDLRAAELYGRAAVLDPGDPYAVGNVLEYEIAQAGSLEPVQAHGVEIAVVLDRCTAQIAAGENLPWAAFDLAKFSVLTAQADRAFEAGALAIARSTAAFMIETSLASIERIEWVAPGLVGVRELSALFRLGLAAAFGAPFANGAIEVAPDPPLVGPVLILAGSSSSQEDARVRSYADVIAEASRGNVGSIVSGGTRQGVSALAGDVSERLGIPAFGYAPGSIPAGVQLDDDPKRYAAVRRTDGEGFGALEPLAYWQDVVKSKIDADDVRMLAIGGGPLSALEYKIALALGGRVGVMARGGGAAAEIEEDPAWNQLEGLWLVDPNEASLASFMAPRLDTSEQAQQR